MAVKLEDSSLTAFLIVEREADIYEFLSGGVGIPQMRWLGDKGDFNIMISDLLGPSLNDLFVFCNKKFSLKTVLLLADQMICRIKYIHTKSILHVNIKPHNFLMGTGRLGNLVYIVDFGLSREYRDLKTKKHRPYHEGLIPSGTFEFMSINTYLGVDMCNTKM